MKQRRLKHLAVLLICIRMAGIAYAQDTTRSTDEPGQAKSAGSDNTSANERDSGSAAAGQQNENAGDQELTRKIRSAITQNPNFSIEAHNVQIITRDGFVTLRGPVRSESEKTDIGDLATSIAGAGKVSNELEVAAKESN